MDLKVEKISYASIYLLYILSYAAVERYWNLKTLCLQVSQAFAEMMFRHGFVHCDPHEANLLVRPLPSSRKSILGEALMVF